MSSLPYQVIGCSIFVHSHNPHRSKLDYVMLILKKGTNVIILRVVVSISPWMSPFMK